MIKVLHVHTLPVISGSGINTYYSMMGLDRGHYRAELACAPGGALIDLVRRDGMEVRTFRHLVQPMEPHHDLLGLATLFMFLKRHPYHIVHTHNSKAGFVGRLAARLAGVPVIVHTVHGFSFHDEEPLWRRRLFRQLERTASRWCDKMIFISQPLLDWALREGITHKGKIVKIYSGIDLDRFQPVTEEEKARIRRKWSLGEEDVVIGMVSKLWEGKGHMQLIEAFRSLREEIRNARLVIVGEGYLHDRLRARVDQLNLKDAVIFTGFLMEVAEILATFDVAVLPSFFEGMGRVLLEAMAMEKPVVASRVGGIPDLVTHGLNGFLVRPGDVNELKQAIATLVQDRDLAERMGKEGRKRITEEFTALAMVQSIEKVYRELLQEKGISLDH